MSSALFGYIALQLFSIEGFVIFSNENLCSIQGTSKAVFVLSLPRQSGS